MLFWSKHTNRNLPQPSIMGSLLFYTLDQISHIPQPTNYTSLKWAKQILTGLLLYGIFRVCENRVEPNVYMAFAGLLHELPAFNQANMKCERQPHPGIKNWPVTGNWE